MLIEPLDGKKSSKMYWMFGRFSVFLNKEKIQFWRTPNRKTAANEPDLYENMRRMQKLRLRFYVNFLDLLFCSRLAKSHFLHFYRSEKKNGNTNEKT
jgi:hypothetical protein